MKTSELIRELHKLMEQHGDLPVTVFDWCTVNVTKVHLWNSNGTKSFLID